MLNSTDTTATSGLINLLVRPLVGFLFGEVSGTVRRLSMEQLMGDLKIDLKFASKVHFESYPILGLSRGLLSGGPIRLMYLCYCLNLQIDMGSNMGM